VEAALTADELAETLLEGVEGQLFGASEDWVELVRTYYKKNTDSPVERLKPPRTGSPIP
jgi:hypothetical protein